MLATVRAHARGRRGNGSSTWVHRSRSGVDLALTSTIFPTMHCSCSGDTFPGLTSMSSTAHLATAFTHGGALPLG